MSTLQKLGNVRDYISWVWPPCLVSSVQQSLFDLWHLLHFGHRQTATHVMCDKNRTLMSLTDAILASNCNWFRTGLAVVVPASSDRSLINMFVALLDVTVHALKPAYVSWGGPLQSIRTFILTIYTVHIILGICIKGKYIFVI